MIKVKGIPFSTFIPCLTKHLCILVPAPLSFYLLPYFLLYSAAEYIRLEIGTLGEIFIIFGAKLAL